MTSPLQRLGRWIGKHLVLIGGLLVLVYTFIPIAVVILMSFNQPKSKLIYKFDSFTLGQLAEPLQGRQHVLRAEPQHPDRAARHRGRHHPRDDDGLRAGPAPLPGSIGRPTC